MLRCSICDEKIKNNINGTNSSDVFEIVFEEDVCDVCSSGLLSIFYEVVEKLIESPDSGYLVCKFEQLVKELDKHGFEVEAEPNPTAVVDEFLDSI